MITRRVMVGSHHTHVLENLEKMLDMYRQRCCHQSAEIAALKQALGSIPIKRHDPTSDPTRTSHGYKNGSSKHYIDHIADELEQALERSERLEVDVTRLHKRLQVEQEWRYAAMEWMESDRRMHKHISKVLFPDSHQMDEPKRNHMVTTYQQSLNKVMERSRELDQKVSDMLS